MIGLVVEGLTSSAGGDSSALLSLSLALSLLSSESAFLVRFLPTLFLLLAVFFFDDPLLGVETACKQDSESALSISECCASF